MAPPPEREDFLDRLNGAFDGALRAVDEINRKFQECTDNASKAEAVGVLGGVLGAVAIYQMRQNLDKIAEDVKKLIGLVEYAVQHRLPVISLIYQAFNWLESVKAPMSEMSTPAGVWRDENLESWREDAGWGYRRKVTEQQGAINQVTAMADSISKWLMEIAQTNVGYMLKLAEFAAEVAGKIAETASNTATIVNAPFAIDDTAGLVGSSVEAWIKNLVGEAQKFVDTLGKVREAEALLADYTKFPGGKWPETVVG